MGSSMQAVRRRRLLAGLSLSAVLAMGASACGGEGGGAEDGKVRVVTSTNVWASVVAAVGGDHVEVIPIISDAADPHSYQAAAADAAEVRSAELLVYNGGGYDDFFAQLAEGADVPAVVAVEQAGAHDGHEDHGDHSHEHGHHSHGHEHGNEHVWYDLEVTNAVAER